MAKYESPIQRAVANPPTMLAVPWEAAALNFVLCAAFSTVVSVALGIAPVIGLPLAAAGHVTLIVFGQREPHLVTLAQSIGKFPRASRNIVPFSNGVKYAP